LKGRRVFASFEDAKSHVLAKREELRKKWEARVAGVQGKTASA
jgi:hypothetical protein